MTCGLRWISGRSYATRAADAKREHHGPVTVGASLHHATATSGTIYSVPFVVALSCIAAFGFALSASLQQRAANKADRYAHGKPSRLDRLTRNIPVMRLFHRLVREPIWLIGWLVNVGAFFIEAVALHLGSVQTVQSILVLQLMFTLPLAAFNRHQRVGRHDWLTAGLICAAVALFLVYGGTSHQSDDASRTVVLLCVAITAVAICGLIAAAAGRSHAVHATFVSIGAGLCFALTAVLLKLTTSDLLDHGVVATALDWPLWTLVVVTFIGLLLGQDAFATGSLAAAIAAMTITNPFASYVMGVLAFHTDIQSDPRTIIATAVAAIMIIIGVIGLAQSPLTRSVVAAVAPLSEETINDGPLNETQLSETPLNEERPHRPTTLESRTT
jgi:drug/metabolite transporter (DMT)-like permease